MQFIQNGPDIPDALLQAHAEGRVVFFCGAGISYPAGLKGFDWLVDQIYRVAGTHRTTIEERAALLTYAALNLADVFTPKELYNTFSTLPQQMLGTT